MTEQFIERRIIIGLITSTKYIQQIQDVWNVELLESPLAKRIAIWCMEYYEKFQKAPQKDIEGIYFEKLKEGTLPQDIAEEIEEDILPALSDEYEREEFNVDYLLEQTKHFFQERHLEEHSKKIGNLVRNGDMLEAEQLAADYRPLVKDKGDELDLSEESTLKEVESAFTETTKPLIKYPKQLGDFLNDQLLRGKLVAFMGSSKRGKSFLLWDMAKKAVLQNLNVAFFQAGDMSRKEQIIRIGINLCKKSNLKKYSGKMYEPVRDCIHNQRDECERKERECDFGIFDNLTEEQIKGFKSEVTQKTLVQALKDNPDYEPCTNCRKYKRMAWGVPWLQPVDVGKPLEAEEAMKAFDKFFVKNKRRIMLSTHPNDTLSLKKIKGLLDVWERQRDFIPDVIIIDYADLLVTETKMEERAKQNEIWKGLRNLSQHKYCLVVTATQGDAKSYKKYLLDLDNFSEDKRKYDHVTAMYGLNQDPDNREKNIGLIRLNELIIRDGSFDVNRQVYLLQNLYRGVPIISSFY